MDGDTDLDIMFVYFISTLQEKKTLCYVYNVVFEKKEGHSSGNRFCMGQAPKYRRSKSRPTKLSIGLKKGPAKKGPNPKVQKFLSKKNGTMTSQYK